MLNRAGPECFNRASMSFLGGFVEVRREGSRGSDVSRGAVLGAERVQYKMLIES